MNALINSFMYFCVILKFWRNEYKSRKDNRFLLFALQRDYRRPLSYLMPGAWGAWRIHQEALYNWYNANQSSRSKVLL